MAKRRTPRSSLVDTIAVLITEQNRRAYEEDMLVDLSTEDKVHRHATSKEHFYADDADIINVTYDYCANLGRFKNSSFGGSEDQLAYYRKMIDNPSMKNRFLTDVKQRVNGLMIYGSFWLITLEMTTEEITKLGPVFQYPEGIVEKWFGLTLTDAQTIAYKERFGYEKSNE